MVSQIDRLKAEVRDLVEELLAAEECELVDVVVATHKKSVTIRLFVHSRRGTTLDECVRLSKVARARLDESEAFPNGYNLEVSSLGLDRPMCCVADFQRRIGEVVAVQFVDPKRKKTKGKLLSVDETEIVLENESGRITEALADIEMARIVI